MYYFDGKRGRMGYVIKVFCPINRDRRYSMLPATIRSINQAFYIRRNLNFQRKRYPFPKASLIGGMLRIVSGLRLFIRIPMRTRYTLDELRQSVGSQSIRKKFFQFFRSSCISLPDRNTHYGVFPHDHVGNSDSSCFSHRRMKITLFFYLPWLKVFFRHERSNRSSSPEM